MLLTDLDPDGLNIVRCYRFGADSLANDTTTHNNGIHWLGIKTHHVQAAASTTQSQQHRTSISSTTCRDPVSLLSARDRKLARHTLARIAARCPEADTIAEQLRLQTQTMLMMNVKAEMQWLDDAGDLTDWLDEQLVDAMYN
ncbi:hypothetical protein CDD80_356 [Ophiocordyceps camponoti-rufipedis]|uniref:Topoisomerase 6 subunit A/Spo11 TOPRIM domain-containing protein n=1 Tax=Ophiocordyceps camponoti-rufipedis TaxID=2004952 RepID=A0A2C5ZKX9_9HYPO|nr:hypothetical protein CDD80_356 [Ophiocordyceps camponoti-rufipedis]